MGVQLLPCSETMPSLSPPLFPMLNSAAAGCPPDQQWSWSLGPHTLKQLEWAETWARVGQAAVSMGMGFHGDSI